MQPIGNIVYIKNESKNNLMETFQFKVIWTQKILICNFNT